MIEPTMFLAAFRSAIQDTEGNTWKISITVKSDGNFENLKFEYISITNDGKTTMPASFEDFPDRFDKVSVNDLEQSVRDFFKSMKLRERGSSI